MVLDSRFFQRCATTDHKGQMLESYKAIYARSTMVLFSRKSKTPLAAMTLKADDVGCLSMMTRRPSPKNATEPYFQGMLNMPNQSFTFTISNLSDKGLINFNILHAPHRVSEVNPGPSYGINEVNELHRNQSYTIEADQRNNRAMLLSGKTKTVRNPNTLEEKEVNVTVKESESGEKPTGLYFYLSVVPDKACKSLVDQFAEGTIWKVVPGFVRRIPKPIVAAPAAYRYRDSGPPAYYGSTGEGSSAPPSGSMSGFAGGGAMFGYSGPSFRDQTRSAAPRSRGASAAPSQQFWRGGARGSRAAGVRMRAPAYSGRGRSGPSQSQVQSSWSTPDTARPMSHQSMMAASPPPTREQALQQQHQAHSAPWSTGVLLRPPEIALDEATIAQYEAEIEQAASAPLPEAEIQQAYNSAPPPGALLSATMDVDVGTTQAAELKYGKQVNVYSSETGHDYAYEHCSEPTVLCLSIWNDMKFLPLPDIQKELDEEVEEWKQNEGKALIESLNAVYKTDTCVIDLESEADTIICTCGHQCIHHSNVQSSLRKCPVCRSFITAFVRADGILVD